MSDPVQQAQKQIAALKQQRHLNPTVIDQQIKILQDQLDKYQDRISTLKNDKTESMETDVKTSKDTDVKSDSKDTDVKSDSKDTDVKSDNKETKIKSSDKKIDAKSVSKETSQEDPHISNKDLLLHAKEKLTTKKTKPSKENSEVPRPPSAKDVIAMSRDSIPLNFLDINIQPSIISSNISDGSPIVTPYEDSIYDEVDEVVDSEVSEFIYEDEFSDSAPPEDSELLEDVELYPEEHKGTGLVPSPPDGRDYHFESLVVGNQITLKNSNFMATSSDGNLAYRLPNQVDLREGFFPIRDQGKHSTCVGHAAAAIQEYFNRTDTGLNEWLSPQYIYNNRDSGGPQEGMYLRNAAKILREKGVCREALFEHGSEGAPNDKANRDAVIFKVQSYARVDTIEGVKVALATGSPVMAGFPSGSGDYFWRGNPTGGHAVVIVGFNNQGLIIRNSWGEDWMDRGYGIISYQELEGLKWREFWTLVDMKNNHRVNPVDTDPFKKKDDKGCCILL